MPEQQDFQATQYAFAAHIRDPDRAPAPGDIEDRRMGVYRELLFNNVSGFLAGTLPVLHGIMDASDWQQLMRDFFARHQSRSPYFLDIPKEFLAYLQEERQPAAADPPFLFELAHYEWAELALSVAEDGPSTARSIHRDGDLLAGHPVVSPLAWPLSYAFPVHRISGDYQPQQPGEQPTFLLLYRDAEDSVRFLELNPVSARLIGLISENAETPAHTGREALERIAAELQHPAPQTVIDGGLQILSDWSDRGIILGTSG